MFSEYSCLLSLQDYMYMYCRVLFVKMRLWSRKIFGEPSILNHEIFGAQHLSFYKKRKFLSHPKAKIRP